MGIVTGGGGGAAANSITSEDNSTSTPLNAGNTFTGEWEVNSYPDVMVSLITDQNGTLYIDFSLDEGVSVDSTLSFKYDTSRINPPHILVKGHRYTRVRFTNDSATNQTALRLQTDYGSYSKLTAPVNGTLAENFDAIATRSTDFHYEVAMGKRQGHTTVNKFGYNLDLDTGTEEIIASFGGAFDPSTDIMTTAQTFDIAYNSSNDGAGKGGALSLLFTYLDEDFLIQTGIHTLGSSGSDTTSFSGLGINRIVVLSTGSDQMNNNTITVTATTDGTTQAQIPAGASVTQQLIYHTPINHNLLADWLFLTPSGSSGGFFSSAAIFNIKGYSWSRVTETRYDVLDLYFDSGAGNGLELKPSQPFIIGGREVFYVTATVDTNNSQISGRFSGMLERID